MDEIDKKQEEKTVGIPKPKEEATNQIPRTQEVKTDNFNFDYVLLLIYPKYPKFSIEKTDALHLIKEFERKIEPKSKLLIILDSPGGEIYTAVKMVDIIRSSFSDVKFVVPLYAKSAATLMSLAGDEIIMSPQSELGPLDLPYEHPHLEGEMISAYDVVRSLEYLQDLAVQKALEDIGVKIRRSVGLSRKESVAMAIKFATDLVTPILSKEDPRIIYVCFRLLLIAEIYGTEFLRDYMFKNEPSYIRREQPSKITRRLIWDYPDHSFSIRRCEAKRIGLKIKDSEELPEWNIIWKCYNVFMNSESKIIKLLNKKEFLEIFNK
jgi:hypothetical protein